MPKHVKFHFYSNFKCSLKLLSTVYKMECFLYMRVLKNKVQKIIFGTKRKYKMIKKII
jgi:hypothetical protein